MMNRSFLVLVLVLLPGLALAQSGGPNAYGYEYDATTFDYVSAPSAVIPGPAVDDGVVTMTLPWPFDWYGTTYNSVSVSDNGALSFPVTFSITYSNDCLPPLFTTAPSVGVFWDDLDVSSGGTISGWHDTLGGEDRFIIDWANVPAYGALTPNNGGSFQVHLDPSGGVEFHWDDTDFGEVFVDDGADATIGIIDDLGSDPLEYSCNAAQVLEGTAIRFSTCDDSDGDGYPDIACGGTDCDDSDPSISPGVLETCENGLDEDCDGIDNVLDGDGDGYVDINCVGGDDCDDSDINLNPSVDADGDGSNACLDCNDTPGVGAFMFPGNPEVCGDGVDQDCSGADDLADVDGDGYTNVACGGDDCDDDDAGVNIGVDLDGDGSNACEDCDDSDASAVPGGLEVCDGVDNDCDGATDDIDADGDGDPPIACGGGDCDDSDPTVGATTDADGDGSNACEDCNDSDDTIYPGAPELCDDIDTDCDGLVDGLDLDVGGTIDPPTSVSGTTGLVFSGFPNTFTATVSTPSSALVDLNVTMNASIEDTLQATVELTSPAGTTITLFPGVGTGILGAGFIDTVFDDEAASPITSGMEPFTGSFQPTGPLSSFDGEDPNGVWTLTIATTNFFAFNDTLDSWTLDLSTGTVDDADLDGWVACGDCDDSEATVYPGAPETCGDGIDQDCDGVDASGDVDGDGYVDADCGGDDCDDSDSSINPSVDGDGDGSNVCEDCDDADPAILPGQPEVCGDGIDQNCNGFDDVPDVDGDGYIDSNCIGGDDCDDTNSNINPGEDSDGDGFHACEDCNDTSSLQAPDLDEVCGDFIDNDCDGETDNVDNDEDGYTDEACGGEDCDDSDSAISPAVDADGDGSNLCVDCDDTDDSVYPSALEICGDGIDQSCSGADLPADSDGDGYESADCGGLDCDDDNPAFSPDAEEACDGVDLNCDGETTSTDADGDGYFDADCGGLDCDDQAQSIHPDSPEVCNGVDDNCDGELLEGGEDDLDEDGHPICDGDCDDTNPDIFPDALEICDLADNDCDGEIDEGLVLDADGDGRNKEDCGGDDCNDANSLTYPGATEDCADGEDNDCDGLVDGDDENCEGIEPGCSGCSSSGMQGSPISGLAMLSLLGLLGIRRRPTQRA